MDVIEVHSEDEYLQLKTTHKEYSYNHIRASFVCTKCGQPSIKTFRVLRIPFLCSKCQASEAHLTDSYKQKYKTTMQSLYGVDHVSQCQVAKEHREKTCMERYGAANPFQVKEFQEKSKQTNIKNLGKPYAGQVAECRQKGKETYLAKTGYDHNMHNPESVDRVRETTLNRYGAIGYASDELAYKSYSTTKERYGVSLYAQSDKFATQYKQTVNERYGVDHPLQLPEIKEKIKATLLERYGVTNSMQSPLVRAKAHKKYAYDNQQFDSSWELAYYIWLNDHNIDFVFQPNITFDYIYEGVTHKYCPDFLIDGILYDIKGDQFFKDKNPNNEMICPYDRTKDGLFAAKYECMKLNNVKILHKEDVMPYINYINDTYGKRYLSTFKSR